MSTDFESDTGGRQIGEGFHHTLASCVETSFPYDLPFGVEKTVVALLITDVDTKRHGAEVHSRRHVGSWRGCYRPPLSVLTFLDHVLADLRLAPVAPHASALSYAQRTFRR